MGAAASKATHRDTPALATPSDANSDKASSSSKCPVKHSSKSRAFSMGNNAKGTSDAEDSAAASENGNGESNSKCPVKKSKGYMARYLNPNTFNVYSCKITDEEDPAANSGDTDPRNQMPAKANQNPTPGQRIPLSKHRVKSHIPKGGTEDSTWTYPSPQMFWNSISRKGKVEDTKEEDMDMVVAIHNNMNELTWNKVLEWENLRRPLEDDYEGEEPKLLRFLGRPDDTPPKVMMKVVLGSHPFPFDRHDWYVDRGGEERRYIIDYYHDEGLSEQDVKPSLKSRDAVKSIKVDVRPALDHVYSVTDRWFWMPLYRRLGRNTFEPLPFFPPKTMDIMKGRGKPMKMGKGRIAAPPQPPPPPRTQVNDPELQAQVNGIQRDCEQKFWAFRKAEETGDDTLISTAEIALHQCMARHACKPQADRYASVLAYATTASRVWPDQDDSPYAKALDEAIEDMQDSLSKFQERCAEKRAQPAPYIDTDFEWGSGRYQDKNEGYYKMW